MYHPHSDEMSRWPWGCRGSSSSIPGSRAENRSRLLHLSPGMVVEPGSATPNPIIMTDFNLFTFNSRVWPGTDPLIVRTGDRVRVRFANLSMDNHPIHFHGHQGWRPAPMAATSPNPLGIAAHRHVPPGSTRDVEFVADNPGDWAFHCHKNHHTMNAMSHDMPNLIGVDQNGISAKVDVLSPATCQWARSAWEG